MLPNQRRQPELIIMRKEMTGQSNRDLGARDAVFRTGSLACLACAPRSKLKLVLQTKAKNTLTFPKLQSRSASDFLSGQQCMVARASRLSRPYRSKTGMHPPGPLQMRRVFPIVPNPSWGIRAATVRERNRAMHRRTAAFRSLTVAARIATGRFEVKGCIPVSEHVPKLLAGRWKCEGTGRYSSVKGGPLKTGW